MDLIFHHYQNSPFSQKVRSIFGFKNLEWKSVEIPNIMPKPDVVALTGGYRRTPFLQIGADVYCDTALIADVLERLYPEPALYPAGLEGEARTLAQWADSTLFWCAMAYCFQPAGMQNIFRGATPEQLKAFAADRTPFRASIPRMSFPEAAVNLHEMVRRLELMLASGRPFLLGASASIADFAVYHPLWFVRDVAQVSAVLDGAPRLGSWLDRIAAFGNGRRSAMTSAQALELARGCMPEPLVDRPFIDLHGIGLGNEVTIGASDYGTETVQGELVLADRNEWALRRHDERAGEIVVHFPRLGFQMKKAAG